MKWLTNMNMNMNMLVAKIIMKRMPAFRNRRMKKRSHRSHSLISPKLSRHLPNQ
jgi:hypothetical protein